MTTQTITKSCFKCNKKKPLNEYYKHPQMKDGHLNKCIECAKADSTANRKSDLSRAREYDRRRWREDPSRRESVANRVKDWQVRNPEKHKAHTEVGNAVRDGRLIKPDSCSECGCDHRVIHGHHEDYSEPLNVEWLCPVCHAKRHH